MKLMVRKGSCLILGVVTALALAGVARADGKRATNESCSSLYGASICTSYQMHAGYITAFSLRVPVAMVEQAPANAPMVWPPKPDLAIPFAAEVQKQTGFTYATIYWNPHGHGPAAYLTPHFDFHFYFVPERKIEAVDCKNLVKPQAIPTAYAMPDEDVPGLGKLVGLCIPGMGMHAIPAADLTSKAPWKASMMLGYYGGEPLFFEPMVTSALMLQRRSFSLPVPQGVEPAAHVRYPKKFRAVYLPDQKAYDFTFFY